MIERCLLAMPLLALLTGSALAQQAAGSDGVAADQAMPILRTELEATETIPGQPIIFRVTVLVPTWMPAPPVFPSFETPNISVRLPQRAGGPTSERIDGETWSGVTRAYRLSPLMPGRFRIPPRQIAITYADPETREPIRLDLTTDEVVFNGIVPDGAEGLDPFIAANDLSLIQTIEGDPANLEVGDAVTRVVKATIDGTSPIFIPSLIADIQGSGLAVYPDEPVVSEQSSRGSLAGERLERVTYLAEAGGRHQAPPVVLEWFNLATGAIERAEVEGFELVVRGSPPQPSQLFGWRDALGWIVPGVLGAFIVLVALRRLWPPLTAWREARHAAYLASERCAFDDLKRAIRARDVAATAKAMTVWSQRLTPVPGPEQDRLERSLVRLGMGLYGRGAEAHGRSVPRSAWTDLRSVVEARRAETLRAEADQARAPLPPLNPRQAT